MPRRWWVRQAWMSAGFVAFTALTNIAAHHSWRETVGWTLGVLLLGVLAALNLLWQQRYRPEKVAKLRAKVEARYQR